MSKINPKRNIAYANFSHAVQHACILCRELGSGQLLGPGYIVKECGSVYGIFFGVSVWQRLSSSSIHKLVGDKSFLYKVDQRHYQYAFETIIATELSGEALEYPREDLYRSKLERS